jgi:hypothetical protein
MSLRKLRKEELLIIIVQASEDIWKSSPISFILRNAYFVVGNLKEKELMLPFAVKGVKRLIYGTEEEFNLLLYLT